MPDLTDIKRVLELHTNLGGMTCPECGASLKSNDDSGIGPGVNHMLNHGYVLLHVGSEWGRDHNGMSIHHTVVFVGTKKLDSAPHP
jgi:hypothetical protein